MNKGSKHIVLCNGAQLPKGLKKRGDQILELNHIPSKNQNVVCKLPEFALTINHIPPKCKDLLEIASYVFAADRNISRGNAYEEEFENWSRNIHFVIPVREYDFWSNITTNVLLSDLLEFMTGDLSHQFTFITGKGNFQEGRLHTFD